MMTYKILVNSVMVFESIDILHTLNVFSKYIELKILSNKFSEGASTSVELYMDDKRLGNFTLNLYE
jgi:hypothetical protein